MEDFNIIESVASAIVGAIATIVVGYFTLRGQLKQNKTQEVKDNKDFILELQRQISVEREQMNQQRIEDSKAMNQNMALINTLQQQIVEIQKEVSEWRKKYLDMSKKYNGLHKEHLELLKSNK